MPVRDAGAVEALGALPDPLVAAFALVTLLGDVAAYFLVFSVLYWLGDRTPFVGDRLDRELIVQIVALGFVALALVTLLKHVFTLPRPPGADTPIAVTGVPDALRPLVSDASVDDGYGFPSGHAIGSTVVYGGLGWLVSGTGDRRPLYVGATLAALVSLSRVVVGVHYLGDVLAGVALGVALLFLATRYLSTPGRSFPAAGALAAVGLVAVGPTEYLLFGLGASLGATAAWVSLRDRIPITARSGREALVTAVSGILVVGGLLAVVATLDLAALGTVLAIGVVLAALVAVPVAGARLDAALG
ncbi:PAP2 superfamily protein [Halorientalis persicus]|jgi:membrane-associated phospholipid phosphatase|uniref:PAP2 superfamily protein n=1 Tax=Halorientalis persicus TaxID=1367881 RepID=A0A1H8GZT9_9EURY|nr:phosphatase PAP2 family protein [Halorientalis persicus]SEN49496.1 PAP2 superfamily protein [Halorientalis persicus]